MMSTCQSCRWWDRLPASNRGRCDIVNTVDTAAADHRTLLEIFVATDDDSGLRVELHTGIDFGCVHHIPKK